MDRTEEKPNLTPWLWIKARGFKGHFCTTELRDSLTVELLGRSVSDALLDVRIVEEACIDLGGMWWMGNTHQRIEIGNMVIAVPTRDFEGVLHELREAPVRYFQNDQPYYKVHGYWDCVVLTSAQKTTLLAAMVEMLPTVRVTAKEEDEGFGQSLKLANKNHEVTFISRRDPESIKKAKAEGIIQVQPISGTVNGEKN